MKKIKILFAAMALFAGTTAYSQAEATKDGNTEIQSQDEAKPTMKDAANASKVFTTEMCEALRITDKSLMQTISSINENYEVTLLKSTEKSDMTEEEIANLAGKLESNRVRRFQGILTPAQLKIYQTWKAQKDAATEK